MHNITSCVFTFFHKGFQKRLVKTTVKEEFFPLFLCCIARAVILDCKDWKNTRH